MYLPKFQNTILIDERLLFILLVAAGHEPIIQFKLPGVSNDNLFYGVFAYSRGLVQTINEIKRGDLQLNAGVLYKEDRELAEYLEDTLCAYDYEYALKGNHTPVLIETNKKHDRS